MVHRDLVMNMLRNVDRRNHGILDWASYLHAMTYIRPYDLEARVESCISTVEKLQIPSKELVQKIVEEEGGGIPRELQLMEERSIDFDDFRIMCLLGF